MVLNMSSKYWLVTRGKHAMATVHSNNRYIIGFQHKHIAQKIAHTTPAYGVNKLVRSMQEDIALDVKKSMIEMELAISNVADSITIDVEAQLYIPKLAVQYQEFDLSGLGASGTPVWFQTELDVVGVEFQDFLMFPFEKHLGVIIPYELEAETSDEYVFQCSVIDPATPPSLPKDDERIIDV